MQERFIHNVNQAKDYEKTMYLVKYLKTDS